MKTNKEQLLRNSDIQPTSDVIAEALGASNKAYLKFINELPKHDIDLEYRYYSDGKAWLAKGLHRWIGARGGKKEITVFWLSIWDGYFKVTIYVPEKARADVLSLPLDDGVKQMVAASKQMGKLKNFPLTFDLQSDEMFDAFFCLADFRRDLK